MRMTDSLNTKAFFGIVVLAVVMGLVLFVPAGMIDFWQAWVYLGIFFGASIPITVYLMRNNPALLRRRLGAGPTAEKRKPQKIAMLFASFGFVGMLVVPSLDHRFEWSSVPLYLIVVGDTLSALCFYITFLAYKENPFTSATIEIAQDQNVISTGPYAIVRHPMYAGGLMRPPALSGHAHPSLSGRIRLSPPSIRAVPSFATVHVWCNVL
jgi:hypothetical protein